MSYIERVKRMDNKNLSMLCDFYELTMSNGYFKMGFTSETPILMCFSAVYWIMAALQLQGA